MTFGIERRRRRSRAAPWSIAASTAPARGSRRRHGAVEMTTPLVGRGNLANVLAATAVALRVRRAARRASSTRAAQLRPAAHRGEVVRLADGVTIIDDSYNANPTATQAWRSTCSPAAPAPRRIAVLGEMLELGDHATALHEDVGRAAARRRRRRAVRGRRRAGAARWPTRRSPRACRRRSVRHFATSDEAADAAAAIVHARATWCWSRDRAACKTDRVVDRLKAERRLMLYHLLYPFHTQLSVLNVTRYITFRTAAASLSALAISLVFGPWLIRQAARVPDRPGDPHEGPQSHRPKAGTPTMGGLLILTAALVPTLLWADLTNVYVWIAVLTTAGFGAIGFARRLPEDRPPLASRPAAALQDGLADADRRRGRRRAAGAAARRALQHAAGLSVLQAADSRSRLAATCRSRCSCWSPSRTR